VIEPDVALAAAETRVAVELEPGWGFLGKMHGGYLLATIVGAAMGSADRTQHPHPGLRAGRVRGSAERRPGHRRGAPAARR
jgi:hypothetical protein